MMIINDLAMRYGTRILFTDVNLHIKNNKRYGLVEVPTEQVKQLFSKS